MAGRMKRSIQQKSPAGTTFMVVLFMLAAPAFGQHEHAAAEEKKASLMPGFGVLHHPVSTRNAEAQQFFEQGLVLIYGFNHEEAARSFRRATELDPKLAMAYWGIALAVGPNYNEPEIDVERVKLAYEALKKAQELGSQSAIERDYIAALAKRFSVESKPDYKRLGKDYADAMGVLYRTYPDDLDAATLYADSLMNIHPWQLWTKDGKPGEDTEEIVAVLESVLRRDPNHIGANHLYIHAVEASRHPERALPSAERLSRLNPSSGHLVHMPAHIYIRTGSYDAAAIANEEAAEADRKYIKANNVKGSVYTLMYYSHNLHFLVESYNRTGQLSEARKAARQLDENVRPHVQAMPMVEAFMQSTTFVLLRFGKWDEILRMPAPDQSLVVSGAIRHYARSLAFAAAGKISEAGQERTAFANALKQIPAETPYGALNKASTVFEVAKNIVDARIAWASKDRNAAIDSWRKAVAAQDALSYDEPPAWYYPVHESLGAALLLNGDAAGAEQVFRQDLLINPRNARSLFGLSESLKAQNKSDAAAWVEREFVSAWKKSEVKLKLEDL
jgi:tetratricopeptide (TPR) repeat protein